MDEKLLAGQKPAHHSNADAILRARQAAASVPGSVENLQRVLRELQIEQMALESENKTLLSDEQTRSAKQAAYSSLYEDMFIQNQAIKLLIEPTAGSIVEANPAACEFYGYPLEKLREMRITDINILPPDTVYAEMQRAMAEHRAYFRFQHRLASGEIRDVEVHASPIDVQGRTLLFSVVHDITEQVQAEKALQRQNQYLTALQETTLELISQHDLDILLENIVRRAGQFMNTSAAYLALMEWETGQLRFKVGTGVLSEWIGRSVEPGKGITGIVWQTGQPLVMNDYPAWPDHRAELSASAVRSIMAVPLILETQVLGVLGLAHDHTQSFGPESITLLSQFARLAAIAIENAWLFSVVQQELTERRRVEEMLRKLNVELEDRVEQRTQELQAAHQALEAEFAHHKQVEALEREVQVLQEIDRLRSELIGNVSHELRTPLGIILVTVTALRNKVLHLTPATRESFLQDIEDETRGLQKIVDNLLDAARLQSGSLVLEQHRFDLRAVIDRLARRAALQSPQHHWHILLPDGEMPVTADESRIEQVLRNLLDNAIKYSPTRTTITVAASAFNEQIQVTVSDEGPGIPLADRERIFTERFYRITDPNAPPIPGIGLGLNISYHIIKAHGGRLWVEDRAQGAGSSFIFLLNGRNAP